MVVARREVVRSALLMGRNRRGRCVMMEGVEDVEGGAMPQCRERSVAASRSEEEGGGDVTAAAAAAEEEAVFAVGGRRKVYPDEEVKGGGGSG